MNLLFWIGVGWLVYVHVGYPVLVALLRFVRQVRPAIREDFLPTVSVLIAARNEEKDIGWKVQETLGWNYPADRLEVLVASDASEDRTDQILGTINDARLRFVRMESRGGKNVALNRLAQLARGDLLFFTDANCHIDAGCLRKIVRHFADERVACVTAERNGGEHVCFRSDRVVFEPGQGPLHRGSQFRAGGIGPQRVQRRGGLLGGLQLSRHAGDRP